MDHVGVGFRPREALQSPDPKPRLQRSSEPTTSTVRVGLLGGQITLRFLRDGVEMVDFGRFIVIGVRLQLTFRVLGFWFRASTL